MKNPSVLYYARQIAGTRSRNIEDALERATKQFEAFQTIGQAGADVSPSLRFPRTAARLKARAARLRGQSLHAFTVLAELQAQIGRLELLADSLDD